MQKPLKIIHLWLLVCNSIFFRLLVTYPVQSKNNNMRINYSCLKNKLATLMLICLVAIEIRPGYHKKKLYLEKQNNET